MSVLTQDCFAKQCTGSLFRAHRRGSSAEAMHRVSYHQSASLTVAHTQAPAQIPCCSVQTGTRHSRQPACRCCHRGRPLSLWPSGPAAIDSCSGDNAGGNSCTKPRRSAPASSACPLPTAAFISRRASRDSPGRAATWRQQGSTSTFDTRAHLRSCSPTWRQLLHVSSRPYQQALLLSSLVPLHHRSSGSVAAQEAINDWLV